MKQILQPVSIAEKCTLEEAIYWITFNIFPIEEITENGKDVREDLEYNYEDYIESPYTNEDFFTEEICDKYKLPKSYKAEHMLEHGEYPYYTSFSWDKINELKNSGAISQEDAEKFIKENKDRIEYCTKQKPFDDALDEHLETPKTELVLLLRKGTIKAYGRLLEIDEVAETEDFTEHKEIPASLWKMSSVEWDKSALYFDEKEYLHILIDVDSLLKVFPEPELETIQIYSLNGTYLIDEDKISTKKIKKKGRPPYDWKHFTEEMARRFSNDGLPSLQKTCVIEMQEWCAAHWEDTPSETNLKEHISPFYKARKSQKIEAE